MKLLTHFPAGRRSHRESGQTPRRRSLTIVFLAFILFSSFVIAEEIELPTVMIEGRELRLIPPGESVIGTHERGHKIRMPDKVREAPQSRYLLLDLGAGSEDTKIIGWMSGYRQGKFAVDIDAKLALSTGVMGDDANVFDQKTSFYLGTDEGASFRLDLKGARRLLDLPGPDWAPFTAKRREFTLKSAAIVFSGELLSETSLDITMEMEESIVDDDNADSDIYTRIGLEARGRYGRTSFGYSFREHDLDDVYTARETRAFVLLDRVEIGENVTSGIGFHVQDYGNNGVYADPDLKLKADLGNGIAWETTFSGHMTVMDFEESYGTKDYTIVNRLEQKPERKWRLETSFSKTFAELVKVQLYGFGEYRKDPILWDLVGEPVAAQGFYTLVQIEGYTTRGGGLRAELEVGKDVRLFLDTLFRDYEKDSKVAGVLSFAPRVEGELGIELRKGRFTLLVDAAYRGEMHYNMESRDVLEETIGLGGRLEYATPNAALYIEGANLAGEDYLSVQGYPTPESSWILGVRLFF